ncbi:MAG TPA: hypothetical protein VHR66_27275 [Gemmataceae bacterium]|jgi:hypothetical protein|nr:hypothetical protein [Gemmataceae bacterium]
MKPKIISAALRSLSAEPECEDVPKRIALGCHLRSFAHVAYGPSNKFAPGGNFAAISVDVALLMRHLTSIH